MTDYPMILHMAVTEHMTCKLTLEMRQMMKVDKFDRYTISYHDIMQIQTKLYAISCQSTLYHKVHSVYVHLIYGPVRICVTYMGLKLIYGCMVTN